MRTLSTLLLFLFGNSLYAQVEIVAEQDQYRNLSLMAFNKEAIPYTIRIEFVELENLKSLDGDIIFKVATTGKSNLVELQSIYINEKTGFRYNTKLYKGDYQPSDESTPPYLIPVEAGTALSMRPLTVTTTPSPSNSDETPYAGIVFFFEKPAIICAPRKGIVSEIKMDLENNPTGPVDLNSENFIEIYHQDGTFSRLTGLKAQSAKVGVGETVFPGQEIAESTLQEDENAHHVKMIQSRWEKVEFGMIWINFPITIYTDQQELNSVESSANLTSSHPTKIISMEMNKKELKKYLPN